MFEGVIIKETLTDELLLDFLTIDKVEIWKTSNAIKYWTMVFFHSDATDLPKRLSDVITEGWFADMKDGDIKYIIFKDEVLKYRIGNQEEKEQVLGYMRTKGIPEEQFGWSE